MKARELTNSLGGRWQGSYGTAKCPAHDDRSPSLQLSDGESAVLLTCHGGCERQSVIDALKSRGLWHHDNRAQPTTLSTPRQIRGDAGAKRTEYAQLLVAHDLHCALVLGQRVVERYFLLAQPFFLATLMRRADVLRQLDQLLDHLRRGDGVGVIPCDGFFQPVGNAYNLLPSGTRSPRWR